MDPNPYAPPAADRGEVTPPPEPEMEGGMTLAEAEALRRRHLTHEARLQSVGTLMLLGALNLVTGPLLVLLGIFAVIGVAMNLDTEEGALGGAAVFGVLGLMLTGFGALSLRGGRGLRRLDPQHLTLYTVLVLLWLLSCSIFSLLGLWALVLLHAPAGKIVLSPEYAEARRLTPHIRFKTSVVTWIVLGLLVLGLPLAMFIGAAL
ncbi:MAG: hypothetical protein IPN01_00085 [Deltaproteobacteria bacterium]|nr:hypothetical protein [Deltaproteobacteria bacterium]